MARSLLSGLSPQKSLLLSAGVVPSKRFQSIIAKAAASCNQGLSISEALRPDGRFFPHFFLPLISSGELGGRQAEAFRLVREHCLRLKPALVAVRKTWLYPLVCVLFGWTVRAGLFLGFGLYHQAWLFVCDTFFTSALIVAVAWVLLQVRLIKEVLDYVKVELPMIREVEIRMSVALFFSAFRLLYSAGGLGVLTMFDHALETVRNSAVRRDLLKARHVLERNGGFDEAFNEPVLVESRLSGIIATSAMAGQLNSGLDKVVALSTEQLEHTLTLFNQLFFRLMGYAVAMSIVGTLWFCLQYSQGK
jgi:type II secretory pathway component PulF